MVLIATPEEIARFQATFSKNHFCFYPKDFATLGITNLKELLESPFFQPVFKKAFQSFFKATGDVHDIFEAAEAYLQKKAVPSLNTETRLPLLRPF